MWNWIFHFAGKNETRKFIQEALDYALDSGYLKPEDSTCKLLRVSSELVKSKNVTSGKRARSSSDESQIYDDDNDKSYRRKKQKITAKTNRRFQKFTIIFFWTVSFLKVICKKNFLTFQ